MAEEEMYFPLTDGDEDTEKNKQTLQEYMNLPDGQRIAFPPVDQPEEHVDSLDQAPAKPVRTSHKKLEYQTKSHPSILDEARLYPNKLEGVSEITPTLDGDTNKRIPRPWIRETQVSQSKYDRFTPPSDPAGLPDEDESRRLELARELQLHARRLKQEEDERYQREVAHDKRIREIQEFIDGPIRNYDVPGTVIHEARKEVGGTRELWEEGRDGARLQRNPQIADAEIEWYQQQALRLQNAKDTGRFDGILQDDPLTQTDVLDIAKTAAMQRLGRMETEKTVDRAAELALQRARQEKGYVGEIVDPDITLEYANQIMDKKHKRELYDYQQQIEAEAAAHQQLISERMNQMDDQISTASEKEKGGFFRRVSKLFNKGS